MNDALTWLTHWLADVWLLGSALLLLAHLLFWIVRQPGSRMTLAWGTVLGLLALMVLAAFPLWPRQSLLPAGRGDEAMNEMDRDINMALAAMAATPPAIELSHPPIITEPTPRDMVPAPKPEIARLDPAEPGQSPLVVGLLRVWLAGAALALGWIALGAWQAARLLRGSQESPAWTRQELAQLVAKRRQPRLLMSPQVATAVALGASRPHILLPAASVQPENAAGVRAALAHEWAHIRHGDLWLLALERLLLPVFFWHPLFWLFRRRVRFDQELLADAAAAGEQPVEYAEALLAWAKSAVALPARPPWGMAALSLWENPRSLIRRVEMILQADPTQPASASRPWRFFVLTSLLAVVLGLSVLTLRPTATAQEGVDQFGDRASTKDSSAKKKKQKKARDEARLEARSYPDPVTAEADRVRTSEALIQMDLMIYELAHEELAVAETDLGGFLQETSRACRAEDHLIIADYTKEQLQGMLQRLNKEPGVAILSRPKVMTISDQDAQIQVGNQVPLVQIAETVNGKTNSRVESINAGLELTIKPHLHSGHMVELAIVLEQSRLLPAAKDPATPKALPALRRRKLQVETEVLLGETVVIAERARKSDGEKPGPILLLLITPTQPVAAASQPSPNTTAQLQMLHRENDLLRQQVIQLQKKLNDAQAQLQWLREAATAEGREKVSDQEFVRRVYLDLTGILPTADETRAFINDQDAGKRSKLLDRLLSAAAPPLPAGGDRIVKVFALQDTPAQRVMDAIKQLQQDGKTKIELQGIAPDERTNSIVVAGKEADLVIIGNVIAALDKAGSPPAETPTNRQADALAQRLRALDIREAEINLRAAQAYLERMQAMAKTAPVSVPQQELLTAQFEAEKAALALESIKSAGDPLAKQKLEVRLAEVRVRTAQAHLERSSILAKEGSAPVAELDAARFEVEKAEVDLERAKARLEATPRQEEPRSR